MEQRLAEELCIAKVDWFWPSCLSQFKLHIVTLRWDWKAGYGNSLFLLIKKHIRFYFALTTEEILIRMILKFYFK